VPSFYADSNFINISYAIDIALFSHFANLLFNNDQTRVVYASNAYAFRKRANDNEGNLNLPFMNFKTINYNIGMRERWNVRAASTGVYISELEKKLIFSPVLVSYEASFWCHRDDELRYAISETVFDADNKTILRPTLEIDSEDVFLSGQNYDDVDVTSNYDNLMTLVVDHINETVTES
jgi:hypothetical protein